MPEDSNTPNKDYDKGKLAESQSQHPDKKQGQGADKGSAGGGKLGKVAGAAAGHSATANKAIEAAKFAMNAARAAAGDVTAALNLLRQAIKDPKMVLGIVGAGCFVVFLPVFFVIFLIIIIAGSSASVSEDELSGLCKDVKPLSAEDKEKAENHPYNIALKEAEKSTGVYHLLIVAVDYQENQFGLRDPGRDPKVALTDIGNKIQEANYERNSDGTVRNNKSGDPVRGLPNITGKVTDNFAAAIALINYQCVFVKHKDESGDLNNPEIISGCFSMTEAQCLQNGIKDKWMVNPLDSNQMGAFLFYLTLNHDKACQNRSGSLGSIGVPGARDANNIPILNNFKQGNWGGDGDPSTWADINYKYFGCSMAQCGCSVASASIVLRWYGCDIDPLKAVNIANSSDLSGSGGGGHGVYGELAKACGMCVQGLATRQDVNDWLLKTHEPMVYNTVIPITAPDTGGNGHFVAMAGFDGQNYFLYDPGRSGDRVTISPSALTDRPIEHVFFYKPADGVCR